MKQCGRVEIGFGVISHESKIKKVFLATNNKSKRERVIDLFARNNFDVEIVTPQDLEIDIADVSEDGTLEENAIAKAQAYFGLTDLPIIANDTSFYVDGENLDPVKVKRNALGGKDESEFTQEEISQKIHAFYENIAQKKGGSVDGYWYEIWAMVLPDGTVSTEDAKREVVLTDRTTGEVDLYFPMRSLYYSKVTGKTYKESTQDEYLTEMQPIFDALKKLIDGVGKENQRVILFHGKHATSQDKWYPWLKNILNGNDCDVFVPDLPKTCEPVLSEWVEELEKLQPDEDTILVGHSRGGVAILRYLEQLSVGQRIKKVILVATNYAKTDAEHTAENTYGFYTNNGYDFAKIKSHCDDFTVLHSRDDKWVPFAHGEENTKGLDAKFLRFNDRGHFGRTMPKQEIPELLEEILLVA